MWFDKDFERIALNRDIPLKLETEVLPWKYCLIEVQDLAPFCA